MSEQSCATHLSERDPFVARHVGPSEEQQQQMLQLLGLSTLEGLVEAAVPQSIRSKAPLSLPEALSEVEALGALRQLADNNQIWRSFIGMGYYGCHTPTIIQRNILENPGWYTQYTPYQAEISQGRLEALAIFQSLVSDLTALPLANASLLDEATAAAEAMTMAHAADKRKRSRILLDDDCHPQTVAVLHTRAGPLGIEIVQRDLGRTEALDEFFAVLLQYPTSAGGVLDYGTVCRRAAECGATPIVSTDLLALTLLRPPGEFGAEIAIGSAQRFGVPLGYGGPHAAFIAVAERFKRQLPGRIVGLSKDAEGRPAYRLALQTREQHIRRERATSNICTAQVLLAIMAGMYAVYHGPAGLRRIALRVQALTQVLAAGLRKLGFRLRYDRFFDTLCVEVSAAQFTRICAAAESERTNLRQFPEGNALGISLDETCKSTDVERLWRIFAGGDGRAAAMDVATLAAHTPCGYGAPLGRESDFLTSPTFHRYQSEHELLRYLHRLQARDLSLTAAMIPLGSCTMKLNASTEMQAISWPEFSQLHPFVPQAQAQGYRRLCKDLEHWIAEITGLPAVSLQPNAGAQGEYAGLLAIRGYHRDRGQPHRDVCLIPLSAHGTNPASAVMAGMRVVTVGCDDAGNVDLADLRNKAERHRDTLSALMITYPSTHGVFEEQVLQVCQVAHEHGGQVYLDGANMNALVGVCRVADLGADVCHLNLHKTFCIPHGGGGPGMGPIAAAKHLKPFLPGHPLTEAPECCRAVSAAPYGSAGILPIPWAYIAMMGGEGLRKATLTAILNANYLAKRLSEHYEVLFRGEGDWVAHEFIIDFRPFRKSAGITVDDVAKRLIDFGFHPPTMAWPVAGTMMIEPTESESREELDRFCGAMIAIREEIAAIEAGQLSQSDNPLKMAPHTTACLATEEWARNYSRRQAAYPLKWLNERKFWPPVARVDNAYGDRNLVCSCPSPADFE